MTMLMVSGLAACAADAQGAPESSARVIVRFRPGVANPADPVFLGRLAAAAHVARIEAIRPMSGEAYVMQVICNDPREPGASDPCAAAIARLGSTDPVIGIEVDQRAKHQ